MRRTNRDDIVSRCAVDEENEQRRHCVEVCGGLRERTETTLCRGVRWMRRTNRDDIVSRCAVDEENEQRRHCVEVCGG